MNEKIFDEMIKAEIKNLRSIISLSIDFGHQDIQQLTQYKIDEIEMELEGLK